MFKDPFQTVDYEKLVEAYKKCLTTDLRGFRPPADFLETWVHDEDDVNSILNIVEAAEAAGLGEISVYIGPVTLGNLDLTKLQEVTVKVGEVRINRREKGIDFKVSFAEARPLEHKVPSESHAKSRMRPMPYKSSRQADAGEGAYSQPSICLVSDSVHPVYLDGLHKALQFCRHEGMLNEEPHLELVQASHEGMALQALIHPSTHRVVKARYHGAVSEVQRGLLEVLCKVMEGRPVLECSDHAVIYMEYELRDHSRPSPVPGIITPENADPAFALPTLLIRALLAEYRRRTGFRETVNFYEPPPAAQWQALSEKEKIRQIQMALDSSPAGCGVEVQRLEGSKRIVVKFNGEVDSRSKQRRLMQLESYIKVALEPTLQLYMQPKMDENKIRRIKLE